MAKQSNNATTPLIIEDYQRLGQGQKALYATTPGNHYSSHI